MKIISKSKTINFSYIVGFAIVAQSNLALFKPILSADHFAWVTMGLGLVVAFGGHYLRTKTTQALKDK